MEKSKKIYYNLRLIELKSKNQIKREISQKKPNKNFSEVEEFQNTEKVSCQKFSSEEKFDINNE